MRKDKRLKLYICMFILMMIHLQMQAQIIVTGKVSDQTGQPLIGVNVLEKNTSNGAVTDDSGNYKITVSSSNATLSFSFIGYKTLEQTLNNTASLNVTLEETIAALNEIQIVGTRRTDRTALETPVPVDIIQVDELTSQVPQTDLTQLLNYMAPSFNSTRQVTADGADHIDAASLRGLGPDQTLVLINGKRRHTTALINLLGNRGVGNVGTDLNTIPTNTIDRIEILRDGAAAQYGSDAIAGVMNIKLKNNNSGGNITLNTGIHQAGDGEVFGLSLNKGLKLSQKGFLNLTGDVEKRGYTIRKYSRDLDSWPVFAFTREEEDAELAAHNLTYDNFKQRNGNSKTLNARLFYNAGLNLSEKSKFYSFGGFNYRKGEAAALWRVPSLSSDKIIESIYPFGFQPLINTTVIDGSFVLGYTTRFQNEWQFDISTSYGTNSMMYKITNTNNASMGDASPTSFDAGGFRFNELITNASFNKFFQTWLSGTNIAFGTEYRKDGYNIIEGEEASWKDYENGEDGAPGGSQGFVGFSPESAIKGTRNNLGIYFDIESDITASWTTGAALRFENYSDFGSAFTYKLSTRYQVAKPFAIRGAFNTGFRAPALQQIMYRQLTVTPTAGGGTLSGIFNNKSDVAKAAGTPALDPEYSTNISLGLVLTATDNFSLTADFYQIDIKDRIILSGLFGAGINPALDNALLNSNAEFAQFFTNAVDTRTKGLDVVANLLVPAGAGNFHFSAAANFNKNEIKKVNVPADFKSIQEDDNLGNNYVDQRQLSLIQSGNPKSKFNFTGTYAVGAWQFLFRTTYFGQLSYYDYNYDGWDFGSYYYKFTPKTVIDISFGYKFNDHLTMNAGVNNLFDTYPDTKLQAVRNGRAPDGFSSIEAFEKYFEDREGFPSYMPYDYDIIPYEPVQMGFNGRFYFLKAVYRFN